MKILGLLLAFALALSFSGICSAQVNGVSVEISLDQKYFLPDEDVVVTVRISNRSGQTLELGDDPSWLTFSIQGDNGIVVEKLGDVPVVDPFSLKSSQTEIRKYNVTPSFSFRQQGSYTLSATVKIAQWNQSVPGKPVGFSIMSGIAIPSLPPLEFGVPLRAGSSAGAPEVRKYVLQKAVYMTDPKLYFRLTDASGGKTFRVYPVGPIVSFSQPEAQIDGESKLHLLYQFYAKSFCYCVIDPDGTLVIRQIYDYSKTRPTLRTDSEGLVYVGGGVRKYTASDLPAPVMATFSGTNALEQTNSKTVGGK